MHFTPAGHHLVESDALVYHVFLRLDREGEVIGDVPSPRALRDCHYDLVVLLFKHLVDVQGEVEAVLCGVGLDLAE